MLRSIIYSAIFILLSTSAYGWQWHGFVDGRCGLRLQDDDSGGNQRRAILNELRGQVDLSHSSDWAEWRLRSDFVADEAAGEHHLDLELGHGPIDLREANLLFFPHENIDIKIGRQILTWGTGDLLFINDMFPKDWQSFFVGRDEEYLKAPSDAVFLSFFPEWVSVDLVYVPKFNSDRYISGERISYWNPLLNRHAGRDDSVNIAERSRWFHEDEISLRLYRDVNGYELALYVYDGYWKSPVGYDAASAEQTFPRLRVTGGSMRGDLLRGLFNIEVGYYDSLDDSQGRDPLVPNSEYRLLFGYEQEVVRNLSAAMQYYLEYMQDFDSYRKNEPQGSDQKDRARHVVTARLTKHALSQNLQLSLFAYWSPSDHDGYLRPALKYKMTDEMSLYLGANVFVGEEDHTFFGQFEDNSNLYLGARYSF